MFCDHENVEILLILIILLAILGGTTQIIPDFVVLEDEDELKQLTRCLEEEGGG